MEQAFRFNDESHLYLLILVPAMMLLFVMARLAMIRRFRQWGDSSLTTKLMPEASAFRNYLKSALILLALTAMIIAWARPQFGSKLTDVKRKGIELIIALDVSNSMMAEDILPNRLENAKLAISKLLDRLENDKIGLIVFAGDAYVQLPLTTDFSAAKLFLSAINTQIVPRQGTSIKSAIDLALKSFSPEAERSRAIVIITDGENHEEDAVEAAKLAYEKSVVIHTIGMGSPQGAPIPTLNTRQQSDFRTDHEGVVIVTKLNEELLRQISAQTGGLYVRATSSRTGLNTILDEMDKLEKSEITGQVYAEYDEQFPYFIALALFFLLAEILLMSRKNRILAGLLEGGANK